VEIVMGRTNIDLDDRLVAEGLKLTRSKTKKDLVDLALRELVAKKSRKKLLELEGKVGWRGNLARWRKSRV
jgi:Arc/MetJ family transcription regulator